MKKVDTDIKPDKKEIPPPEQAAEWAYQAMHEKKWSEAAQRWAILRKAFPKHSTAWLQGAKVHIEEGELERAEKLLDHGRQYFSENPNSWIISAELAITKKQGDMAEAFLQQARERFPDFAQTWIKSAECSEYQGNIEQATEYNEKARKCVPESIEPFVQYAEMAMRAQQWKEALSRWEVLRSNFPDAPIGYRKAAEAARKQGNQRLARQLLLKLEYGDDLFDDEQHTKQSLFKGQKPDPARPPGRTDLDKSYF